MNEKLKPTKTGKYCPFRSDHKCGNFCGLWADGLKACVIHGINQNLGDINRKILAYEFCTPERLGQVKAHLINKLKEETNNKHKLIKKIEKSGLFKHGE